MTYLSFFLFIIFVSYALVSTSILYKNYKKPIIIVGTIMGYFISLWSLGLLLTINAKDAETAMFWGMMHNRTAIFIAPLFIHFVYLFLDQKSFIIKASYTIASVFFGITFLFPDHFIPKVQAISSFDYYVKGGALFMVFFALYNIFSMIGCGKLFLALKTADKVKRKQIFYILFGFLAGLLGGGTTFPLTFEINIFPFGVALVILYQISIFYVILIHNITDVSVVVREGITKLLSILLLLMAYYGLFHGYKSLVNDIDISIFSLFNVIYLIFACESYRCLNLKLGNLSKQIIKRPYDYDKVIAVISRKLNGASTIDQSIKTLKSIFHRDIKLNVNSIYVSQKFFSKNQNINSLIEFDSNYKKGKAKKILTNRDRLFDSISKRGSFIEYDNVGKRMQLELDKKESHACIPFVSRNDILGLIFISGRSEKGHFNSDDILLFNNLSTKFGLILDRIKAYKKVSDQKESFLEEKITLARSLAGSIAHEVRNPLNALSRISSQIEKNAKKLASSNLEDGKKELAELTSLASKSINRTNQIIDITLGDLRGDKIDKSKFALLSSNEAVKNALDEYSYEDEQEKSRVVFEKREDFEFKGDETMFVYVVFNLVKNALYYLKEYPSSQITISSILSESEDSYNQIIIKDTGPGIPKNKLESIFDSFVTSGKAGGTGLGLPFCRRVMDSFGGKIKCESETNEYTKFILSFPKMTAEEADAIKYKQEEVGGSIKLMLVDDQEFILEAVERSINNHIKDITINKVRDGQQALEAIERGENYDLILMDIEMPIMNGTEASKAIRVIDRKVPILAYTSSLGAKERALSAGMNEYISKSQTIEVLIRNICKWNLIKYIPNIKELETSNQKTKRILLADDQGVNRLMLKRVLTDNGFEVDCAEDGKELMDKYIDQIKNNTKYDAIIADVFMPTMTGTQATKEILKYNKKNKVEHPAPIIAYTGNSGKEDIHKYLNSGMNDYIVKTDHDDVHLVRLINFWIYHSQLSL